MDDSPKVAKMAGTNPEWLKNDPQWLEMAHNGLKMRQEKTGLNGTKCKERAKMPPQSMPQLSKQGANMWKILKKKRKIRAVYQKYATCAKYVYQANKFCPLCQN